MSRPPTQWMAFVFIALGAVFASLIALMVTGRLRIDREWPGLVVGGLLIAVMLLAFRR